MSKLIEEKNNNALWECKNCGLQGSPAIIIDHLRESLKKRDIGIMVIDFHSKTMMIEGYCDYV